MNKVIIEAQRFSSVNIKDFIDRSQVFLEPSNVTTLISFWSERNSDIDIEIIKEFNYLLEQYEIVAEEIKKYYSALKDYDIDHFKFSNFLSEIKKALQVIQNMPKYLGVSSNNVDIFEDRVEIYFVTQVDTFESISTKFYGDESHASDIAEYNGLRYFNVNDADWVGRKILVPIVTDDPRPPIAGVIDGQYDVKILGKEIDSNFSFVDDDIATVEYEDCFEQSIKLLIAKTPRQSIPEFENLGFSPDSIIGKNVGSISTQMILNDLRSLLLNEPTFGKVDITKIELNDDAIIITAEISSILKEIRYKDTFPLAL